MNHSTEDDVLCTEQAAGATGNGVADGAATNDLDSQIFVIWCSALVSRNGSRGPAGGRDEQLQMHVQRVQGLASIRRRISMYMDGKLGHAPPLHNRTQLQSRSD